MPKTRIPSPARSQGAPITPRRNKNRSTRSVGSPTGSQTSGRLTSMIQFKESHMNSFLLSPVNTRRSILTDNTYIEEPKRKSWWKKLDENSRDVMKVLECDNGVETNIEDLVDIEVLSQEKKNYTIDLPDSSDSESISSIVIPQRKLFTQKESQSQKNFAQIVGNRETLAKLNKSKASQDKTITAGTKNLFNQRPKRINPVFPAGLLNISANITTADKTKEFIPEKPRPQVRNIFGSRPATKRKNMFADFIASESEDEILDIQPKIFYFPKKIDNTAETPALRVVRDHSPTSSITAEIEIDDWRLLPSSTMVENQLEEMVAGTPVKKARLSKLTELKESGTATGTTMNRSNSSNRSKNKSKSSSRLTEKKIDLTNSILTENLMELDVPLENHPKANKSSSTTVSNMFRNISVNNSKIKEQNNLVNDKNITQTKSKLADDSKQHDKAKMSVSETQLKNKSNKNIDEEAQDNEQQIRSIVDDQVQNEDDENNFTLEYENDEVEVRQDINEKPSNEDLCQIDAANDEAEIDSEVEQNESHGEEEHHEVKQFKSMNAGAVDDVTEEQNDSVANEGAENDHAVNESDQQISEQDLSTNDDVEMEADEEYIIESEQNETENIEQDNQVEEHPIENVPEDTDEIFDPDTSAGTLNSLTKNKHKSQLTESTPNVGEREKYHNILVTDQANEDIETQKSQIIDNNDQNESHLGESNSQTDEDGNEENEEDDDEDGNDDNEENEEDEDDEEKKKRELQEQIESDLYENEQNEDEEELELNADNEVANESEDEHNESEVDQYDDHIENKQISREEIDGTPNATHDTTGRNRLKNTTVVKSPEAVLLDKTNQRDSFTTHGRNTSVRKTKSILKNLNIRPSLAPVRESLGFSDGTKDFSAEGSGWDSHRTTRKTIRQTMGKEFSFRKSLRALVMEKSAKRITQFNEDNPEIVKVPQANSTEYPEASYRDDEMADSYRDEEPIESDHEASRRMRQTTLELYLQKIKKQNLENKIKAEEAVSSWIKAPANDVLNPFKVPAKPLRKATVSQSKLKGKQLKSMAIFGELPIEVVEDMKYKPPKRFQPSNASWITKRLYKFLEGKLEAKYDYKARVRAEKLVERIYSFAKDLRRQGVASTDAIDVLKHEMARLNIVQTHFDFYQFFHDFMPKEIKVKVVPSYLNGIQLPRHGVFTDILKGDTT